MLHLARNPTIHLPIDATLYDGLVPLSNQGSSMRCQVMCMENGYRLDIDGTFKSSPTQPEFPVSTFSVFTNIYRAVFSPSNWPRGHYRGIIRHASGRDFGTDFTIGLYVVRKLGYSMIYTGSALRISVWVEENGDLQTDYASLTNVKILSMAGDVIAVLGDNSTPLNGVFAFDQQIPLVANRNYVFTCDGNVPGPTGFPSYTFPLMLGLARP